MAATFTGWAPAADWRPWIERLGHDTYSYPSWINQQIRSCSCAPAHGHVRPFLCTHLDEQGAIVTVDWRRDVLADRRERVLGRASIMMNYCMGRMWLLEHMPEFDLHFLPGSVAVNGTSMLDDVLAFALMAERAAPWSRSIPLHIRLSYLLPYAAYHESRQNWRPIFFAKFFGIVATATSVQNAIERLISPNIFTEWSQHYWPSSPKQSTPSSAYDFVWSSSTAPPVVAPFDAIAYGYGSCTSWATMLTYVARALGIPARQVGTPCWNSEFGGVDYRGLARNNPNVSLCWSGGSNARGHGGSFLNNHNWVEVFIPSTSTSSSVADIEGSWKVINVPVTTKSLNDGLCGPFNESQGCGFNHSAAPGHECDFVRGGPGAATKDHEIFAVTWTLPTDVSHLDGGLILDASALKLTNGEHHTPLVWSPLLRNVLGEKLGDMELRIINRTDAYRCKPSVKAKQ